jgi:NADH dehydrogenase
MASSPELCSKLLTIAIVGGGPTGVELAGAIAELARRALAADFRAIDPKQTHVLLLEAGPRLLPNFPEKLSRYAAAVLGRLGVEVRLGAAVTGCGPEGVQLGMERIPAATILWAAGVTASPAAVWLGLPGDRAGRLPVGPSLTSPGHDIYAVGDTALVRGADDAAGHCAGRRSSAFACARSSRASRDAHAGRSNIATAGCWRRSAANRR